MIAAGHDRRDVHTYTLAQVRAYLTAAARARAAEHHTLALIARAAWADKDGFKQFLAGIDASGK